MQFLIHFSRPLLPWIGGWSRSGPRRCSVVELVFISFMGGIVDWLSAADKATFMADPRGWPTCRNGSAGGDRLPGARTSPQSLVHYQTIFGNHPMLVRWLTHRYVLRPEPCLLPERIRRPGRDRGNPDRTGGSRRDGTSLIDVLTYVVIYFIGAVVLVGQADLASLILPLVGLARGLYRRSSFYFVPRMR